MHRYNLLGEAWIPCWRAGGPAVLSLRDLLHDAAAVSHLSARSPAMDAAVFLQVILGAYLDLAGVPRNAREWQSRWDGGHLSPTAIDTWCNDVEARFDLFDPDAPFAQAAGLESVKGETKSASSIDPYRDVGGSTPLFWSPATDEHAGYTPAEATLLLFHALAFDPAGIKTGAAGDPRVQRGKLYGNPVGPRGSAGTVIPVGRNLFETIMLNTPVIGSGLAEDDLPHWRRPPVDATWSERAPSGPLDWLTWLGRRIRLIPETDDDGSARVFSLVLTGGDRFPHLSPDWEYHSAWRRNEKPKDGEPPRRPLKHRPGQHAWQGLPSLVALSSVSDETPSSDPPRLLAGIDELISEGALDETYPLSARIIGYEYGTQSAVIENLLADEIPFPLAAARADSQTAELVRDIATSAAHLVDALNGLEADLRRAAGGDPTPWDKGQRPGTLLTAGLDPIVRRILRGLQREPDRVDDAADAWRTTARRLTRELGDVLLRSIPPGAFAGREISTGSRTRVVRADTADLSFEWRIRQALAAFDDYMTDPDSEEEQ